LDKGSCSLEFSIGRDEPCDGFMVHARGDSGVVQMLRNLAERTGWFALDIAAGEWFHHMDSVGRGWASFEKYRDQVLK